LHLARFGRQFRWGVWGNLHIGVIRFGTTDVQGVTGTTTPDHTEGVRPMNTRLAKGLAGALAITAVATAPAMAASHSPSAMTQKQNIVQVAASNPQFSTLVSLVKKAGLVKVLSGKGPFTVFAPTNAAFAKVPKATLTALGNDPAQLKAVLTYHVVPGKVTAAKVVKLTSATTVQGQPVAIAVKGKTVKINNAKVTKTDIMASNGVIHVINSVLLPPAGN